MTEQTEQTTIQPTIVLKENKGLRGHIRKEARLTNDGVVIATSQQETIDLQFGRPNYDHWSMNLTDEEMDKMVGWWLGIKGMGTWS